jgi:hypothetical protein
VYAHIFALELVALAVKETRINRRNFCIVAFEETVRPTAR